MTGGLRTLNLCLLTAAGITALAMADSTPAKAEDMQALQSQIQAMQAAIKSLERKVANAEAQAAAAQTAAASSGGGSKSDLDLKVRWRGAPEFSSSDGKFKFKVRGRLMADYANIDQDRRITDEGDVSAVELRRARLGVEGVVFHDWLYKFEVDFAADEVAIKDAYVAYANWMGGIETSELRFGNYYVYTSMEQVTSSRFITFLERAAFTEAFLPSGTGDRQIGAGILLGDKHWSFQTGYYGAGSSVQETYFDDTTSFAVRGTVAPINNETTVLHLGASYRHRDDGDLRDAEDPDDALFRYRARGADLHLANRFIDTGTVGRTDDMFVLEGAFVWRSLSVQGEYAQLESNIPGSIVDLTVPGNLSPTYNGWYVDASFFLTGEMRNYESDTGSFGRTKVKNPVYGGSGGWGAWQIAGRYDTLNLSDKAAFIADCSICGDQETWIIGLNWWLTDYTALKFQVSQSEIKGPIGDFNENRGADITGFGMRAQVDW